MSETTGEVTPQVLTYGEPPDEAWDGVSGVDVQYTSSSHELLEGLTTRRPQLVLCLHAPPHYDGIEAVKTIRRFDAAVPVVLASRVQNTMTNLQAAQTQVTWCVELPADKSVADGLFDVVTDASEWFESQVS